MERKGMRQKIVKGGREGKATFKTKRDSLFM
jgi:hypothetical protein